jgi:hypothetical protein
MKSSQFSLYDPPEEIRSGAALTEENMLRSRPFASIFSTTDALKEICRLYGYLMLLAQNLEVELKVCLSYLKLALHRKGGSVRFDGDPEQAKFEDLIDMFESQLDVSEGGSRQLIEELDNARKLRNRLAHGFLEVGESKYYLTPGGRESVLLRLQRAESVFFPLVILVNMVGRAYAAEVGMTAEYIRKQSEIWKMEQARLQKDLQDIIGDDENDYGQV